MLQPSNPSSFVWFWLICSRRGGATAAVVTLDVAVDERKMADGVARSPARLCRSRGRNICYYYRRLEHLPNFFPFVFFAVLYIFFFFSSLIRCVYFGLFSSCCFVGAVQQSSAPLQANARYVFLRHLFICCLTSGFLSFSFLYIYPA